ncbi:MAG: HAMP domain-containing histidine kinase [PVC group bacterium]|nr:HAMP domain-containing histidine kinase [PVC group bacterium]
MKIQHKLFLSFVIIAVLTVFLVKISTYYLIILFVLAGGLSILMARSVSNDDLAEKVKKSETELAAALQDCKEQTVLLDNTKELMASVMDELERTNQELQELDQMRNDFIAYIVHELRNPIIPICEGIAQVVEGGYGEINDKQREMLEISYRGGKKMSVLVNNLLNIAKMEAGKIQLNKTKEDINSIVRDVCDAFLARARAKNIDLKSELLTEPAFGHVDKDKITEVFNNLISNAFKFTDEGSIVVEVKLQGDLIQCSVTDTGRGIAEDDIPKLFDKFQQVGKKAKETGTGLGLSIVKGNIEVHGGRISVTSKEGKGTQFLFVLSKYSEELRES